MSVVVQEQRRRQKRKEKKEMKKGKYQLRVRYKNSDTLTNIETEDWGTFNQMLKKYKGKYEFYCADVPPDSKGQEGFRLDSDHYPATELANLKKYGRHKAWIDPTYKVNGKKICLVFNAQDAIFGTVGTIIGLAVALSIISDLTHDHWHERGVSHTHHGRTSDGKLKVKRVARRGQKSKRWKTRRDGRRYRA